MSSNLTRFPRHRVAPLLPGLAERNQMAQALAQAMVTSSSISTSPAGNSPDEMAHLSAAAYDSAPVVSTAQPEYSEKAQALQDAIFKLEKEANGEIVKKTKDLGKEFKKSKRARRNRCKGRKGCYCPLCSYPPNAAMKEAEEKKEVTEFALDTLLKKCADMGYPVSTQYAMAFLEASDNKIVLAMKAIRSDIDNRERAMEATGRISYHSERPVGEGSMYSDRDMILRFMEDDDRQLIELDERGWDSNYGRAIKNFSNPQKDSWFDLYKQEAQFRKERALYYQAQLQSIANGSISQEEFVMVMENYDGVWDIAEHDGFKAQAATASRRAAVQTSSTTAPVKAATQETQVKVSEPKPTHVEDAPTGYDDAIGVENGNDQTLASVSQNSTLSARRPTQEKLVVYSQTNAVTTIDGIILKHAEEEMETGVLLGSTMVSSDSTPAEIEAIVRDIIASPAAVAALKAAGGECARSGLRNDVPGESTRRILKPKSIAAKNANIQKQAIHNSAQNIGILRDIKFPAVAANINSAPPNTGREGLVQPLPKKWTEDFPASEAQLNGVPAKEKPTWQEIDLKYLSNDGGQVGSDVSLAGESVDGHPEEDIFDEEIAALHKRLYRIHRDIVGWQVPDKILDSEAIRHVREICPWVTNDEWAGTYVELGGGSAALAVAFCEAAHGETGMYFERLGLEEVTGWDYEKEALTFAISYFQVHGRHGQDSVMPSMSGGVGEEGSDSTLFLPGHE